MPPRDHRGQNGYPVQGAGTLPGSVSLIARKPNSSPTQRFFLRASRRDKPCILVRVTLLSFVGLRGFNETGLDKISAGTIRSFKECGNTAFLRDSEPPALSLAQSMESCSNMTVH